VTDADGRTATSTPRDLPGEPADSTDLPDEREVFCLADDALTAVVATIREQQWALPVPSTLTIRSADREVALREVIGYHAYDDAWVPDMLAGRRMAELGDDPYTGDLLGEHPVESFTAIADRAKAAARGLDDLDRVVHCSFGDFPAREYLWQVNMFRGSRAVDIARFLGVDDTLPERLAEGLLAELTPNAEEWRAMGLFGPAVPVGPDATAQQRLLGLLGRDPG